MLSDPRRAGWRRGWGGRRAPRAGRVPGLATCLLLAAVILGSGSVAATPPTQAEGDAEQMFVEAEELLRRGRLEEAREGFRRIIREYPARTHPGLVWRAAARVRLGDVGWRSQAGDGAAASYVEVLETEPASVWTARAGLGLAKVSVARGDWRAAADQLQRIVDATRRGAPDGDAASADAALRRLTLIHRFRLRPLAGQPFWSGTRRLSVPGLTLDDPVHVAASGDGQLLIVDEGMPMVGLVDAERTRISRLGYNDHSRPWWGHDGLPYLPTRRAGIIALGGPRLGFLQVEGGEPVPLKDLAAGARGSGGRWYLLDGSPSRVLRFGPEGEYQGIALGRGREEPVDLATDPRGRLHVLDRETKSVLRFSADGRSEGVLISGPHWDRPQAIEVDDLGNIYVLDRDAENIEVYDSTGQLVARLGPGLPGGAELSDPRDVAVDGQGNVYVADRDLSVVLIVE